MRTISDKPFVYVCSPYRGDIEKNTENARAYCRKVFDAGYSPIAPHLLFPQFLNENIVSERKAGMLMGEKLFEQCRALVVCGDEVTEGMKAEIDLANRFRVPVLPIEAFQPEADRERPRSLFVLAKVIEVKQNEKYPIRASELKALSIHIFIANPHLRDPMGHVDTMLKLPVSATEFANALRSIKMEDMENPDYYFHSISTYDESIRGFLPKSLDRAGFNELNYIAANLHGINEKNA